MAQESCDQNGVASDSLSPILQGETGLMGCCLESCSLDATETIGANYFL